MSASISQFGALNTAALVVPNLYVQIVPPQNLVLNGVPTNIIAVVGSASFGPVNNPTTVGSLAEYVATFGPVQNRPFDLGTHIDIQATQGASNWTVVRVTDGSDTAASLVLDANLAITARYTGSLGNSIAVVLLAGSRSGTTKLILMPPVGANEVFDNIPGSGSALWANMASAINQGNGPLRGPSQWVIAVAGSGSAPPILSAPPALLVGGTDGAGGVSAQTLVGNQANHTGMYSLANSKASILDMCDATDASTWSIIASWAQANGMYAVLAGPAGDNITNAQSTKAAVGLDNYSAKLMYGDWLFYYDQTNALVRLISPVAPVAGLLGNLSPQNSTLNKQLVGILGSQKSGLASTGQVTTYSNADLQSLFLAGIDVVCNPAPGGNYWAVRAGFNSSSNAAIRGDNYTRLTNFIAETLASGMGLFIGQVITMTMLTQISATLNAFLNNLLLQGVLVPQVDGSLPYVVVCNSTNNTPASTSLGVVTASVKVRYGAILDYFIVNLEGGQTVSVTSASQAAQG